MTNTYNLNLYELSASSTPYWKHIPMVHWESSTVRDFIKSEIRTDYNLDRFVHISGNTFKTLDERYCKILAESEELGGLIYQAKENYIKLNSFNDDYQYYSRTTCKINNMQSSNQESNCGFSTSILLPPCPPKGKRRPKIYPRNGTRGQSLKLWQFFLHLLGDEEACPRLIKWDDFKEGTFKFVDGDMVASLWGSRNGNNKMNYEKMTRAMRYYYKHKVLLPVHGKRLVYKFGPSATGWCKLL